MAVLQAADQVMPIALKRKRSIIKGMPKGPVFKRKSQEWSVGKVIIDAFIF